MAQSDLHLGVCAASEHRVQRRPGDARQSRDLRLRHARVERLGNQHAEGGALLLGLLSGAVAGLAVTLKRGAYLVGHFYIVLDKSSAVYYFTHMSKRTPKQQARFDAATKRAQQIAQDRHIRLWNERIAKEEQAVIDNFIGDIATYAGAKA